LRVIGIILFSVVSYHSLRVDRNGFVPASGRHLFEILRPLAIPECPFVNLPERHRSRWGEGLTAEDMKKCVWLPPELVAQIEFLEWTEGGEAHAALAYAKWFYDWDWPTAEREFKAAIKLNPNSAVSHERYSECLPTRAQFDEGIAEMMRSQELDPVSTVTVGDMGHAYLLMGRYDESIHHFQKALDLYPNAPFIRAQLAWSYALIRMYPQAFAEYDKIAEPDKAVAAENQLVADGLGWVYAVSGRRADALRIAKGVEELSSHAYVDFYQLATIYAGLDKKDEAFRLLEKGYQQHSASMPYLAVDPFWDNVRSDPRYADLLRRIGLPQPK